MNKIKEALDVLRAFNVPKQQQNERSALALLSLLSLKKKDSWADSRKIYIRVHDMMAFIKQNYNRTYAENSRETFRRQTLHQFEKEIGLAVRNEDDPSRPTNHPNTAWSISDAALEVIKSYGKREFEEKLAEFNKKVRRNIENYNVNRNKLKFSIVLNGKEITFSPGKHNRLQIEILNAFRDHFCKNSDVLYVGDTANKMLFLNEKILSEIGVQIKEHDILPDIVLFDKGQNRLYLIEAVSSHGPVSNKRLKELTDYFSKVASRKVFVSAFPDFREFKRHIDNIAWETEVWISEISNHMIHFNGEKFLRIG